MPATLTPAQSLILAVTGDVDPATGEPPVTGVAGIVQQTLPALWDKYDDLAGVGPRVQALYVERDALKMILGVWQDEVNVGIGQGSMREDLSDRAKRVAARVEAVQAEIERIERRASANRTAVVAPLAVTAPVEPPVPGDLVEPTPWDANSPAYSGSPYVPAPWQPLRIP